MPKKVTNQLTVAFVKSAKPGKRYADGNGLYLQVKPSGARSWVLRYRIDGRTHDMGLGSAEAKGISLASAREEAARIGLLVKRGINPLAERERLALEAQEAAKASKAAEVTFKDEAFAYIANHESGWKNPKHRQQWRNTLSTYAYPVIGDLPVGAVATPHILQILQPIWEGKNETASRLQSRIERILDSAKVRGLRSGENPARMKGHLDLILPRQNKLKRGHHASLPYADLPKFIVALREREALSALALEFTILTGGRTAEIIGAPWSEVSFEKALWSIPAERMKASRSHEVPLCSRALEILTETKLLGSKYLFPSSNGGPLSNAAMYALVRRMDEKITVHGFRSTFRVWAAEQTDASHEVCEMAISHSVGDATVKAYMRTNLLEKRRALMTQWQAFCLSA